MPLDCLKCEGTGRVPEEPCDRRGCLEDHSRCPRCCGLGKFPDFSVWRAGLCGERHRVLDGRPVDHACCVIPSMVLRLEMAGEGDRALALLVASQPLTVHDGVGEHVS